MSKKKRARKKPPAKKSASKQTVRAVVRMPAGYGELLNDLKDRIQAAQVKATLAVNSELIRLYWQIGQAIVEKQEAEGWGQKIIDRLGDDLQRAFPGIAGFSRTNIYRMRAFFQTYRQAAIVPQAVGQLTKDGIPQVLADIPWGHNTILVEKLAEIEIRFWYARQTIEQGWSRNVLIVQIESGAHRRQAKAITNFAATLPAPQSDLAHALLKDPYNFDFLTLREDAQERHLQSGLLDFLREFLLELGVGFSFVGSRYHLEIGGKDYYLDLLFYHLKLRAFVVIDLKVEPFEPEHAGKMNFYLSAVDDLLRHADDRPSIGLILCRESNRVVVEYALRDHAKPIGVAGYTFRREALPKELRDSLPSVKRIEDELKRMTKKK